MCFNSTTEVNPQGRSLFPSSCRQHGYFLFQSGLPCSTAVPIIYIALLSIKHQCESTPLCLKLCDYVYKHLASPPLLYSISGFSHYLKCPANLVPPCRSVTTGESNSESSSCLLCPIACPANSLTALSAHRVIALAQLLSGAPGMQHRIEKGADTC